MVAPLHRVRYDDQGTGAQELVGHAALVGLRQYGQLAPGSAGDGALRSFDRTFDVVFVVDCFALITVGYWCDVAVGLIVPGDEVGRGVWICMPGHQPHAQILGLWLTAGCLKQRRIGRLG